MTTTTHQTQQTSTPLEELKAKQHQIWSNGDYRKIAWVTVPLAARKQWLADRLSVAGRLQLDAGAVRALTRDGKSLLPIGVVEVSGEFARGAVVASRTLLVCATEVLSTCPSSSVTTTKSPPTTGRPRQVRSYGA